MSMMQGFRNGGDDSHRFTVGQSITLHPMRQIAAIDEFRDDEVVSVVGLADVVHRDDVGMIQTGDGPCFDQVVFLPLIAEESLERHFDRHRTSQLIIPGR